jgi:excisionase family DNA binding protein
MSTGAAAALAACHPTTILRAIQRGELQAVRLGRHGDYRIDAEALEAWLQPTPSEEKT